MNLNNFTFIDLFAGIGGIRIAFENIGGKAVFSSEIDVSCQNMYEAYFGDRPKGDITKIAADDIPNHDILLGGFPCQAFSIIGNGRGFADTRGTMFFEIERILKAKKPHAFLLENVKQLKTHDGGKTFKIIHESLLKLGYFVHFRILNALDYGVPHKRERIFIVGFRRNYKFSFPMPSTKGVRLEDVLEKDESVDKKHFASKKILESRQMRVKNKFIFYPSIWHENKSGNVGIHSYSCALRAGASYNYLLVNGVRRLTPRENLRLQGFPENYPIVVPDSQIRKQAGNSVAIPCVLAVARQMKKAILEGKLDTVTANTKLSEQLELV